MPPTSTFSRAVFRCFGPAFFLFCAQVQADVFDVTVDGSDAIFLAGREDVLPIPPIDEPFILVRPAIPPTERILETLPPAIPVASGDVIRALDPGVGGIDFFASPPSAVFFGPDGNGIDGSFLSSLAGISGYRGPEGPLVGVFLDDGNPALETPPPTLDFSGPEGTNFVTLGPELRQIFYIGDGRNDAGDFHEFIAPEGATRLMLGIPDGFAFDGAPGYYGDNDGAYQIRIGVNEIPEIRSNRAIPVPVGAAAVLVTLVIGIGIRALRESGSTR